MTEFRRANDPISGLDNKTLGDFWSWAFSDVMMNTTRGVYAEWLVAQALGVSNEPREEWAGFDLTYQGIRIEVKASAYLQSWKQSGPSKITFDIRSRAAQIHIFGLQMDEVLNEGDALNPERWCFYVVPTRLLPLQKSIRLQPLINLCNKEALGLPVNYSQLRYEIDIIIQRKLGS